LTNIRHPHDA